MAPRSTKEWIGKRDDSAAPPRVRLRIFERAMGRCHICKLPIKVPFETWQADHVIALINGGENREGNLAPAHSHCHLAKTKLDVAEKAKVADVRQKHLGIKPVKQSIPSRPKPPKPRKDKLPMPERKVPMYQEAERE